MSEFKISKMVFIFSLCLCCLMFNGALVAKAVCPERVNRHINDYAAVIAETDVSTMEEMLKLFEKKSSVVVVVAVVKSTDDYGHEPGDIEAFSSALFREWRMEDENSGRSMLIVVSTGDRKMKIEAGGYFDGRLDGLISEVTERKMLPFFRQSGYSRGIYEGLREITRRLDPEKKFPLTQLAVVAAAALLLAAIIAGLRKNGSPGTGIKKGGVASFGGGAAGGW